MHLTRRNALILVPILWMSLSSIAQTSSTTLRATSADTGAIVNTVQSWYSAASAGDKGKFFSYVTPDFQIFDEGRRFTGEELFALGKKHLAEGSRANWTVSHPEVSVDCNTALAIFTTLGSFSHAGHEQKVTFLESAVLRKAEGRWRIAFFHSTAAPEALPPASENK